MKVSVNEDKSFTPVTLTIIIESEEEFATLKALAAKDFSVPHFLEETKCINPGQKSTLSHILVNIHNELRVLG